MPTHLTLADFYNKALQGKKFTEFKEYLMGWKSIEDLLCTLKEDSGRMEDIDVKNYI